jgi:hypothetical protein
MQKISSYLYPNRVQLLVDLAGFTTEYTNVYQKNVRIYKGIDNTLEFDIKNADQKRLELITDSISIPPRVAVVTDIRLTVLDTAGNELLGSPYTAEPSDTIKGIAIVTIPASDITDLANQYLQYNVRATKNGNDVLLYGDTRFGAMGRIELAGSVNGVPKTARVYKDHISDINLMGEIISRSPAIPTKFYEAVASTNMNIHADIEDFIGTIYVQGTTASTISVESWKAAPKIMEFTFGVATTATVHFHPLDIGEYNYFRVSWENSSVRRVTTTNPEGLAGKVIQITADVGPGDC